MREKKRCENSRRGRAEGEKTNKNKATENPTGKRFPLVCITQ